MFHQETGTFHVALAHSSMKWSLGIASSGFPIPDFSGPEGVFFPDSKNFNSRAGNREMDVLVML